MLAEPLPKRIRYTRMAQDQGRIAGVIGSQLLERLAAALLDNGLSETVPLPDISVALLFESNGVDCAKALGGASFDFCWCCQRCLDAVALTISIDVDVVLSHQPKVIERIDFDQDSLLLEGEFVSVAELIEDQLLLALPMSPKHLECEGFGLKASTQIDEDKERSTLAESETEIEEGRQRPFADLKAMTQKVD